MAASTTVNGRTVVHRESGGALATFPDVCLTPTPGGPVPVPYPNLARSADLAGGAGTVTVDGCPVAVEDSVFSRSTGDEPGTQKGVVSRAQGGEARFLNWSFDVKVEGKGVCRLLDPMASNGGSPTNTPPAAEVQPPLVVPPVAFPDLPEVHYLHIEFMYAGDLTSTHPDHTVAAEYEVSYSLKSAQGEQADGLPRVRIGRTYNEDRLFVPDAGGYSLAFARWELLELPLKDTSRADDVAKYVVGTAGRVSRRFDAVRDEVVSDRRADSFLNAVGVSTSTDSATLRRLSDLLDTALDELDAARGDLGGNRVVFGRPERYPRITTPDAGEASSARTHLAAAEAAFAEADAAAAVLQDQAANRVRVPEPGSRAAEIRRANDDLLGNMGLPPIPPLPDDDRRVATAMEQWRRVRAEIASARAEIRTLGQYLTYETDDAP